MTQFTRYNGYMGYSGGRPKKDPGGLTIAAALENDYGVSPTQANPLTVIWAIDNVLDLGACPENVKHELSKINRIRAQHGKAPVCIPFGHAIF